MKTKKTIAVLTALTLLATLIVQPGQSIQAALNAAVIGETIHVASGTYNESLTIKDKNLVCDGACTIIHAHLTGNATLKNFNVFNSTNNEGGIVIKGNGNTVQNNTVTRASLVGIQIQGNNNLVEGNDISQTVERGTGDADGIRFFGDNNTIRNNNIHDITYGSEVVNAHVDCFQTWQDITKGIASNTLIEGNTCDNRQFIDSVRKGQCFMLDGSNVASKITIRNNVLRCYQSYILNIVGLTLQNNTIDIYINGAGFNLSNNSNAIITNNIFYASSAQTPIGVSMLSSGPAPTGGNNWYFRIDGRYTRTDLLKFPTDKQGINPLFINPVSDFHLQSNSPACGAGAYPCGQLPTPTPTATPSPTPAASPTATMPAITKTPTPTNSPPPPIIPTVTGQCFPLDPRGSVCVYP